MENSKNNNSLLYSLLVSMESADKHEVTFEDLLYSYFPRVTECQKKIYRIVIEKISEGLTLDEIVKIIDKLDIEELKMLDDNQQLYVKEKVKKDVMKRKRNLEKREGEKK